MIEQFNQAEVSTVARKLLELGLHPSVVRRRLAERGLHWEYAFRTEGGGAPQGLRQRLRNLRKQGLGLCSECHTHSYPLGSPVNVCSVCLEAKFSSAGPMDRQANGPLSL